MKLTLEAECSTKVHPMGHPLAELEPVIPNLGKQALEAPHRARGQEPDRHGQARCGGPEVDERPPRDGPVDSRTQVSQGYWRGSRACRCSREVEGKEYVG
jgi:hypothetical protein